MSADRKAVVLIALLATAGGAARFVSRLNGAAIVTLETQVNGASANQEIDVRAEYNAVNDPDLTDAVGWVPTLYGEVHDTFLVPGTVASGAGPFNW